MLLLYIGATKKTRNKNTRCGVIKIKFREKNKNKSPVNHARPAILLQLNAHPAPFPSIPFVWAKMAKAQPASPFSPSQADMNGNRFKNHVYRVYKLVPIRIMLNLHPYSLLIWYMDPWVSHTEVYILKVV